MNQESCIVLRATPSSLGLTIRGSFGYGHLRNKSVMYFHVQEAWNCSVHLGAWAKAMRAGDPAFSPGLERWSPAASTPCGSAPALLERNSSVTLACSLFCLPLAATLWRFFSQQRENSIKTNKQTKKKNADNQYVLLHKYLNYMAWHMNRYFSSVESKIKGSSTVLIEEYLMEDIISHQICHQEIWMWSAHLRHTRSLRRWQT